MNGEGRGCKLIQSRSEGLKGDTQSEERQGTQEVREIGR